MQNYESKKTGLQDDIKALELDTVHLKDQIVSSKLTLEKLQAKQIQHSDQLETKRVEYRRHAAKTEDVRLQVD